MKIEELSMTCMKCSAPWASGKRLGPGSSMYFQDNIYLSWCRYCREDTPHLLANGLFSWNDSFSFLEVDRETRRRLYKAFHDLAQSDGGVRPFSYFFFEERQKNSKVSLQGASVIRRIYKILSVYALLVSITDLPMPRVEIIEQSKQYLSSEDGILVETIQKEIEGLSDNNINKDTLQQLKTEILKKHIEAAPKVETQLEPNELAYVTENSLNSFIDKIFYGVVVRFAGGFFKNCIFVDCYLVHDGEFPYFGFSDCVFVNFNIYFPHVQSESSESKRKLIHDDFSKSFREYASAEQLDADEYS